MISTGKKRTLTTVIPVAEAFIPLAAAFVAQGARGLGLDSEGADALSLATEEVMAYLVGLNPDDSDLEIRCFAGSWFVETSIALPVRNLQLQAFNMTASVCAEDEACLEQMGLLIASRMCDRFQISRSPGGNLLLRLVKEKTYPEISPDEPVTPTASPVSDFTLQTPDAAQIKWFIRRVNRWVPAALFPADFRCPGKVVDMAAAGDFRLLLAVGAGGAMGGGIAWRQEGEKTIEIFGPYVFHDQSHPDMARALLEACIGDAARSPALAMINRMPAPSLPDGYLEALTADDGAENVPGPRFRMMHEDPGCVVWCHPELAAFLRREYRRMVFPRDIQETAASGETPEPFSVLSAEMDRGLGRAILRPVWPGVDAEKNLADHAALLRREGITSIFFEMDLGRSDQTMFTPGLLALGFVPRLVLPYAGTADLVIFELEAAS